MIIAVVSLLILLVAGFIVGYYLGFRKSKYLSEDQNHKLSSRYITGLNYLLDERPDKAVDVFMKMVEVDSETVETHLALGNLFRRRGEVDRATRIHQNIIARPSLSRLQRLNALYELGLDYMRAGFLDRAEDIYLELADSEEKREKSLLQLLDIYQQQHEWYNAINIAEKLQAYNHNDLDNVIAHYYCELAEQEKDSFSTERAMRIIKKSLSVYYPSIRAHIMLANFLIVDRKYRQALKTLHYLADKYPRYLSEFIEQMATCYHHLGDRDGFEHFLRHFFETKPEYISNETILKQWASSWQDKFKGLLTEQLKFQPTITGIKAYVDLQCKEFGPEHSKWKFLHELVDKIAKKAPRYQCRQCGLSSNVLSWYCPSCKHWDTVMPQLANDIT